ncbi:MAG TPA: ATP-binding protein [Labilithrix sp.]|nr:ATP-binding protein [Labilithrix sp.]
METPAGAPVTVRERVLLELARREKSDAQDTFAAITEAASAVLDVARVSIWELQGDESPQGSELDAKLICKDLYLSNERKHVTFMPIYGRDFPAYLRAIRERRTITADDAQRDPRTSDFSEFYLKPLGITSMMDVPIWRGGHVYGVLCFEHVGKIRKWRPDEEDFAINMTDIASSCLEASERVLVSRRWTTVIEALSEGVVVLDPTGRVVQCNDAAHRLFRDEHHMLKARDELALEIDLVDAVDRRIPPEDWPFVRARRNEVVRGEIYGVIFKRTGERRYVRATCSPVVEKSRVAYFVLVVDDVTDEVFVERLKRELLSGLAHELKTPLAIAKGYAQQLQSSHALPERARGMLDAIVRACDRMDHLSGTLLDLASMILGRLRLTREHVDFAELALSVIQRAEREAPGKRFEIKANTGPIPVIVDHMRMAQAIRHVVDNSVTYSPEQSVLEIELSVEQGRATLSIRDHGIGIPEKLQSNVFTPFFKAHAGTEHDRGGLGVGLYLAREIVRRHGGDMQFESAEGKGSTFRLTLPLAGEA